MRFPPAYSNGARLVTGDCLLLKQSNYSAGSDARRRTRCALRSTGYPALSTGLSRESGGLPQQDRHAQGALAHNPPMARKSPASSTHLIGNRVASARSTTEKVQEEIQLAEAELHLANLVITDKLADSVSDADLAKAIGRNEHVEEQLRDAGENLKVVTDLLDSEESDRLRLEQAAREADASAAPGSRSGEGSASVIEHLRELTRHKLNADHPEPAARSKAAPTPRSP